MHCNFVAKCYNLYIQLTENYRGDTMQNQQIEKAIAWNPWHGCKKASPGCKNCFVFKMDKRYGRDTTVITKGKTTYELKDKDCPAGSLVKLCFSSDFFIEEADEWRDGCWDFIRRRKDCIFVTTTKRPERIKDFLPSDWAMVGSIFIYAFLLKIRKWRTNGCPVSWMLH